MRLGRATGVLMTANGTTAADFVEVYDEPLHTVQWSNDYALVYTVNIPRGGLTLWHRHCEDTVYCAIGDVAVAETLPGRPTAILRSACGAAISRAHREEPLIHQIENVGDDVVRFVAAEARSRPPSAPSAPLTAVGHHLDWEVERFRVYQLTTTTALQIEYTFHGLLVALQPMTVEIDGVPAGQQLVAGDWRWLSPPQLCTYAPGARGIVIEWR